MSLRPLFAQKLNFWSILGPQGGPKNPPQGVSIIGPRGLGSHLGAIWEAFWAPGRFFLDFDVILVLFWVPWGSILAQFSTFF